MNCCEKCFDDKFLQDFIRSSNQHGTCDYCGSAAVAIIDCSDLREKFLRFLDLYERADIGTNMYPWESAIDLGEALSDMIQLEWEIFSETLPYEQQRVLLGSIYNGRLRPRDYDTSAIPVDDLWVDSERNFSHDSSDVRWEAFADYVKSVRRYVIEWDDIHEVNDPAHWLPALLTKTELMLTVGTKLFRAREGKNKSGAGPIPTKFMGSPPPDMAVSGRANPYGIPYLYLASDHGTAIAEIRPWVGAEITIGEVEVKEDLKLLDLSDRPYLRDGPFSVDDLATTIEEYSLLRALAEQLSKPTNPALSNIEYVPSQYLTEVIASNGFDGIRYASSLGQGVNYVLFESKKVAIVDSKLFRIESVQYTHLPA